MTPRKKAPSNGLFAARDPRAEARVLEREAASYPEERDWTLGEAAHQWRLAGEGDHAIELLQGMLADPEADSDLVRSQLVETYFALDRPDAAYEQIAELRTKHPSMEACQIVGELLEENGDTEQALTWFTMAVTRLTEEEIADLRAGDGSSDAFWLLDARRRVRETQGLPPDELDLSIPPEAPTPPEERGGFPFAPHSTEGLAEAIDSGEQQSPAELRPLFWQREEFHEALERSPELAETIGTDHAAYARRLEARWLGLSTRGVSRVLAVPLDFHLLEQVAERLGGDVHDEDVRGTYVTLMVDVRGDYIAWPPGRNEPCWCGSGTKYKKCCGSPTNR